MVSRICWFTLPFIVPAHLCSLTKDTPFCQPNSHNKKKIVQCAHPCEPASVLHSVSISEIMIWVSQGGCCFYLFCFSVDVRLYTSVAMLFFFTSDIVYWDEADLYATVYQAWTIECAHPCEITSIMIAWLCWRDRACGLCRHTIQKTLLRTGVSMKFLPHIIVDLSE